MALTRTTANFKLREDLIDSITPLALQGEDNDRGLGAFRPAAWLPVQFTKSSYQSGTDAFVISAFKPVSLDTEGKIVPSGFKTSMGGNSKANAHTEIGITYTSDDVDWGVIDITTGLPVTGATTHTGLVIAKALLERGLVRDDDAIAAGAAAPPSTSAHVNTIIDLFISEPVGIVLQDVNVWSGLPEEGDQTFTNYSKQHAVQFLTRATMRVPQRVAGDENSFTFDAATLDGGGTTTYTAGAFIDDGEYWTADQFTQLVRYSAYAATVPVVAIGLDDRPVAKNTDRTPVTCDRTGVLVRERTSIDLITKEGDWYLDADLGVMFLHEDTWATLVALGAANTNFLYSFYTDTGVATAQRYIHFDGPCRPGDFVYYDEQSNFVVASAAQIAAAKAIGRVHKVFAEPRDLLDKVKTAWNLTGASAAMQMPGTATKGYSDLITLSQEVVADQIVQLVFQAA
jgi:hypothetical protein